MNSILFIYIFSLFVITSPNFIFKTPIKNHVVVAIIHAVIFSCILYFTYDSVNRYVIESASVNNGSTSPTPTSTPTPTSNSPPAAVTSEVTFWFKTSTGGGIQLSEITFYDNNNSKLSVVSTEKPSTNNDGTSNTINLKNGEGEGIEKTYDNNTSTKWYDGNGALGSVKYTVNGIPSSYTFTTANDNNPHNRTPVTWTAYFNTHVNTENHTGETNYTSTTQQNKIILPADGTKFSLQGGSTSTTPYTRIGSYRDTSTRALNYGPKAYGNTQESCMAACPEYKYFALQDGNGTTGWCSCSNSLINARQYGEKDCGDTGGPWCNSLYQNNALVNS